MAGLPSNVQESSDRDLGCTQRKSPEMAQPRPPASSPPTYAGKLFSTPEIGALLTGSFGPTAD
jgi:hypothetical protein